MGQHRLIKSLTGGLSGCKLTISPDGKLVRKVSSNKEYNHRLINQIKKQLEFKMMHISGIQCPLITETGRDEYDLEYFIMEYAIGKDYRYFLNYSSPEDIDLFTKSIFNYIDSIGSTEDKYTNIQFSEICREKLDSIKKELPDGEFSDFIENKILKLENVEIPRSFCHGDLTLSNILFSKSHIFILDFLDSYIESWVIDLVKLKQDLFYFWSFLKDNIELNLRCVQTSLKIWESIEMKYPKIVASEEFKVLEALNFLRIYPYAKQEHDRSTIEKIMKKLPIYEEFNNTYGR